MRNVCYNRKENIKKNINENILFLQIAKQESRLTKAGNRRWKTTGKVPGQRGKQWLRIRTEITNIKRNGYWGSSDLKNRKSQLSARDDKDGAREGWQDKNTRMNEDDALQQITDRLIANIEELFEFKDELETQFQYGERVAYTECLEWIQKFGKAKNLGLDFDIEKRFPL